MHTPFHNKMLQGKKGGQMLDVRSERILGENGHLG